MRTGRPIPALCLSDNDGETLKQRARVEGLRLSQVTGQLFFQKLLQATKHHLPILFRVLTNPLRGLRHMRPEALFLRMLMVRRL
jgi:hypothetical protein